jgi:hypothetical protein
LYTAFIWCKCMPVISKLLELAQIPKQIGKAQGLLPTSYAICPHPPPISYDMWARIRARFIKSCTHCLLKLAINVELF